MNHPRCFQPLISRLYVRFLREGNTADFVRAVAQSYTIETLHRTLQVGDREARRGTILALTWLGGAESIAPVGEALRDADRAVRMIAENGISAVWSRAGSIEQCHRLQMLTRWNRCSQFGDAAAMASEILDENPGFSEVWYQRAFARYGLADFDAATADSQQALEANPYHFHAAVGLGQCYLERDDPSTALCCFQWALQVHPHFEFARTQVRRLERVLRKRLDR